MKAEGYMGRVADRRSSKYLQQTIHQGSIRSLLKMSHYTKKTTKIMNYEYPKKEPRQQILDVLEA